MRIETRIQYSVQYPNHPYFAETIFTEESDARDVAQQYFAAKVIQRTVVTLTEDWHDV